MAIPPQFLKAGTAQKGSPAVTLTPAHKKKARSQAIADMQAQDAKLDAKLGANDTTDAPAKGSQPPWLAKGK